jgi:hypothetical protein
MFMNLSVNYNLDLNCLHYFSTLQVQHDDFQNNGLWALKLRHQHHQRPRLLLFDAKNDSKKKLKIILK